MIVNSRKNRGEKPNSDGRFSVFILVAFLFLFYFYISKLMLADTVILNKSSYDLRSKLIPSYNKSEIMQERGVMLSLPADLTPFFFKKIPVNKADKKLLMTVKGIGPKLAESILQSRSDHGPFKSGNDLLKINSVGEKRARYFETVLEFDGGK